MTVKHLLITLAMVTSTAYADKLPVDVAGIADTSRVIDLDEIIVVSQPKESFLLRRQAVGSNMFSAADLRGVGATDLRSLAAYVPSFVVPQYGARYTSSMYVRGVGARSGSPAVGVYLDQIPLMSRSAQNHHSYGLERVDILRGPQSTLYGINTEGGLVRMYTANPMHAQGTRIDIGGGSHALRSIEASHAAKLSDKLACWVGGFYNGTHGYLRNVTNGQHADDSNEAGGRMRWLWQPDSKFTLDAIVDYQYVNQHAFPYGLLNEEGTAEAPATGTTNLYRRSMVNAGLTLTRMLGTWGTFTSTTSYQYLRDYMHMDIDYMAPDYMRMEEWQQQTALTHEMVVRGSKQWSGDRTWYWTFGTFAAHQWSRAEAPVHFDQEIDHTIGNGIQTAMYRAMLQSMTARFVMQGMSEEQAARMAAQTIERAGGVAVTADLSTIPGTFRTPLLNLAAYHQTALQLTPRLTATLGLRFDYSRVSLRYHTASLMQVDVNVMGQQASTVLTSVLNGKCRDSYRQLLPKVGLVWQTAANGSNLYVSLAKGYRAGGFNHQMFSDILRTELSQNSSQRGDYDIPHTDADYDRIRNTISYAPETTWNIELGSHLYLFDRALTLDVAAYHTTVNGQQLSVMAGTYGFGRMMVNAGRSRSLGFEATLRGQVLDNRLAWSATYGYTHATFRDYTDSLSTTSGNTAILYRGHRVPYVPRHTMSATADYRIDLPSSWCPSITVGAHLQAAGSTTWDAAETFAQPLYAVVGARVSAQLGRQLTATLWGENLTSTRYNTFAIESAATGEALRFAQQGVPFQMGIQLLWNF